MSRQLSPLDFPESPLSRAFEQPLFLGLFLPVQSGGWSPSALPRSTTWTFDYNRQLTLRAEALGFDLVFALAEWLGKGGYGGDIRYHDESLDAFITQAALASVTERILLISTLHVLYGPWHPLHLAKFGATLDHISGGRWGINILTGHRAIEHEMFGNAQIEHDQRYQLAGELFERGGRVCVELGQLGDERYLFVDFGGCGLALRTLDHVGAKYPFGGRCQPHRLVGADALALLPVHQLAVGVTDFPVVIA